MKCEKIKHPLNVKREETMTDLFEKSMITLELPRVLELLAEQTYDRLLEKESLTAGWSDCYKGGEEL